MKYLVVLFLCFMAVAAQAQTDGPNGTPVVVLNTPLPVAPPALLPNQLRSAVLRITTDAGKQGAPQIVSFDDPQVILRQISYAPTASPSAGLCRIILRINDLIAWVGQWQPPVGIDEEDEDRPSAGGIAGEWEPPGAIVGIVMTPNDVVDLRVNSVNARRKAKGVCQAEFVVLATSTTPPLTD